MTHTAIRFAAPTIALLSLAACASGRGDPMPAYTGLTPTEQFAIEVRQQPDEIRLAPHAGGLSPTQENALAELADRWRSSGGGLITIQTPGGVDPRSAESARAVLITLGASPEDVRVVGYSAPGGQPAPLIVGYAAYEAVGPQCGTNWDNLASNRGNKPFANFGCAVTANVASQIANPRDLVTPRTMDPADASRRAVVLDKYRKGETTSTQLDQQAVGTLSNATPSQ